MDQIDTIDQDRKPASRTDVRDAESTSFDSFTSIFEDLYDQFPRECHEAGSYSLTIMKVQQEGHEKIVPANPDLVFRLVTGPALTASSVDLGEGQTQLSGRQGSVYLAPADAQARWQSQGKHELLMIAVPAKSVREILDPDNVRSSEDPFTSVYGRDIFHPALPSLMESIWRETVRGGPGNALRVDGLFMTLLGTMYGLSAEDESPSPQSNALDAKRLARVVEFIDANLSRPIITRELASVAGFSPYHFSRCFRAATQTSPHRFVIKRRIELGARLLAESDLSLAQIAYECGFASQAHFTTAFKAEIGITPGAYRAAL